MGLGVRPAQSAAAIPHAWDKWSWLPRPAPMAHLPFPHVHTPAHIYFFSHPFFGGSGCGLQSLLCMVGSLDACWALSMDCLSYSRCYHCAQGTQWNKPATCEHIHLFVFPPSLVGAEIGHVCVWHSCSFLWVLLPLLVPSNWFKAVVDQGAWKTRCGSNLKKS
jgi:hypothetical protein